MIPQKFLSDKEIQAFFKQLLDSVYNIWYAGGGTNGSIIPQVRIDALGVAGQLTTDDLAQGTTHLYYTDRAAQDAVGGILSDTATIDFTYDGSANSISAIVKILSIDNTHISNYAGISLSKLSALSVGKALVSDGAGVISVSSTTSTELGYLSGITSAIQTQIDSKQNRILAGRVVTAAGAITTTQSDDIVIVNKSAGAATDVSLHAAPQSWVKITIKDGKGDAAANNITITPAAGTIDGAATYVINANYGVITLIHNGTEWNKI